MGIILYWAIPGIIGFSPGTIGIPPPMLPMLIWLIMDMFPMLMAAPMGCWPPENLVGIKNIEEKWEMFRIVYSSSLPWAADHLGFWRFGWGF
jgi:hypothetical protein